MKWFTKEEEYEGDPIHLRGPDYQNIWAFKKNYSELVCITHYLDSVKSNGLPTSEYNLALMDFDGEVVDLFDEKEEGIIFLIETYGGSRNYWFYTSPDAGFTSKFNLLKRKHRDKKLEITANEDKTWGFIKEYPFELYKK